MVYCELLLTDLFTYFHILQQLSYSQQNHFNDNSRLTRESSSFIGCRSDMVTLLADAALKAAFTQCTACCCRQFYVFRKSSVGHVSSKRFNCFALPAVTLQYDLNVELRKSFAGNWQVKIRCVHHAGCRNHCMVYIA